MKSVQEQIKEKSIADSQAVAGLTVYAARMASDEGTYFFTAPNRRDAVNKAGKMGLKDVRTAIHSELTMLAAKALSGL